jgi:hypothetical protein
LQESAAESFTMTKAHAERVAEYISKEAAVINRAQDRHLHFIQKAAAAPIA